MIDGTVKDLIVKMGLIMSQFKMNKIECREIFKVCIIIIAMIIHFFLQDYLSSNIAVINKGHVKFR